MASLEQRRAKFALEKIEELKKPGARKEDLPKFKSQLLKLPARLHTNGLGQTVAFYLAAGPGKPEDVICTWIEAWLRDAGIYGQGRLIDWITGSAEGLDDDQSETLYRNASVEARAFAGWLKRFAEAFIAERA